MPPPNHFLDSHSPLFRALFEQTREAVMLVDAESGQILDSNPRSQELLGWDACALHQKHLLDLCAPDYRSSLKSFVTSISETPGQATFTGYLERNGSFLFPCELRLQLIKEAESALLLVSFQDISERIRAIEDIELRNIAIANVTSGVTIADARQPDLPLIYVNKGFQNTTGYSAKEAIGRSCRFLQGEDRDQPNLDILRDSLRKGKPCIVQLRNYKKDGTLFYNELHISPVHNDLGELTHFVGIQLDVTEQVQAQESLKRSEARYRQALEQEKELNEIKTRFISMVSHEFRTPMTGIQASASLLRTYSEKLSPEKKAQHLQNIETSLKRMNRLLDDVLFFSRAESDKLKLDRKPLRLDSYFPKIIESFQPVFPDRSIELNYQIPEEKTFLLDEHLLDHILQNLISNALKYSPKESVVSCEVSSSEEQLVIAVKDQGIGIPEPDQSKLFEAFHRAGNVGARQGTGLGLNIVLRAVELLGGDIQFTSKPNAGSTFVVTLPNIQPS